MKVSPLFDSKINVAINTKSKSDLTQLANEALRGRVNLQTRYGLIQPLEDTAMIFLEILIKSIYGAGLSTEAAGAISDWYYRIEYTGGSLWLIKFYFEGNPHRDSLWTNGYPEGVNLVRLFDEGAKGGSPMKPVYGEWHGEKIKSKTVIGGTNFLESAVNTFWNSSRMSWGVIDVYINRD